MKSIAARIMLSAVVGATHDVARANEPTAATEGNQATTSVADLRANPVRIGVHGAKQDIGSALLEAIRTTPGYAIVTLPYDQAGYTAKNLSISDPLLYPGTGQLKNEILGIYFLNNNNIEGTMGGSPESGHGTFNSTYTNPYNVTTNVRMLFDPAAVPSRGGAVTYQGLSIECLPERPNSRDAAPGVRGITCAYLGADTGKGGYPGSHIGTEVMNMVLNVDTNSGSALELNPNFNGAVRDGGITRGLFITGGGNYRNDSSVAIDVNHGMYGGGYAPWGTGLSLRGSINGVLVFKGRADEAGAFFAGIDENNRVTFKVDNNGYVNATGIESRSKLLADISVQEKPHPLSELPNCTSASEGSQAAVTDSTKNVWGADIVGGGSFHVLAYCNGSSWTVLAR